MAGGGRGRRGGCPLPCLIGVPLPRSTPRYTEQTTQPRRALWSNSRHIFIRRPARFFTARFASTQAPRCRHVPSVRLGTSARVLRPKPVNRPPLVLRPKPTNRPASSVLQTRPPPCTLACRCPQVSATATDRPASRSVSSGLTSVLHRSQSIGTAHPP